MTECYTSIKTLDQEKYIMEWPHKLKPASIQQALGLPLAILVIYLVTRGALGVEAAYTFAGFVFLTFAGISLVNYALIRNPGYLLVALFQVSAVFAFGGKQSPMFFISEKFTSIAAGIVILCLVGVGYLWFAKRLKWRIRELLELAAAPIDDTTNGFTPRPRPTGRADYSNDELKKFGAFTLKNHIAIPQYESDRVVFVAADWTQGFLWLYKLRSDYSTATWVAFDYDGNITVNIARRDYLKYKDSLSFDQLCQSLGDQFIGYLGLFRRDEGSQIINKMNAVREHPGS
jgi:hypothetical protein